MYVGEDGDVPFTRSLAVHTRDKGLQNIADIDKLCDPLTYPLLFPTGEFGWHPGLTKTGGVKRTHISQEYYSSLFAIRDGFNPILHAGKLYQQFAMDSFVKIEQNRLNYQRMNQKKMRRYLTWSSGFSQQ